MRGQMPFAGPGAVAGAFFGPAVGEHGQDRTVRQRLAGGIGRPLCLRTMLARSLSPTRPAGFIEPCLPTLARTVPDGSRWAFEIKHDGFRFIARRDGHRVRVFSRNAKDWTDNLPLIVEAMRDYRPSVVDDSQQREEL